jgi:hypothetical protein
MALEVLGRDATLGEDGFIGSGGGARSGSELSHLFEYHISISVQLSQMPTYIGTIALPVSELAEC